MHNTFSKNLFNTMRFVMLTHLPQITENGQILHQDTKGKKNDISPYITKLLG